MEKPLIMGGRSGKGTGLKILLPLTSLCVFFLIAETISRLHYGGRWQPPLYRDHPTLGWEMHPSWEGLYLGGRVKINALGFRDKRQMPGPKAEGLTRILFLGDSVAFGFRLESHETCAEKLEDLLAAEGKRVEVINMGVPGYNTLQEVELLRLRGLPLEPDIVIIAFCLNDIDASEQFVLHSRKKSPSERLHLWLSERCAFYFAVRKRLRYLLRKAGIAHRPGGGGGGDFSLKELNERLKRSPEKSWRDTIDAFQELKGLEAEDGFRSFLAIFPYRIQAEGRGAIRRPQRQLRELGERIGIPTLDLLPVFRAERERGLFRDRAHPNGTGNEVAARAIAEFLKKEYSDLF